MTRGEQIIENIKGAFADIRKRYPLVTDEDLSEGGAIYYMNGNDGTFFDWHTNGNTCEFYMLHDNKVGFIKLYVNVDDTYTAYTYPNGEMCSVETISGDLNDGDALYLATILYRKADKDYTYDANINKIDFSYEPTVWELADMDGTY